MKITILQLPYGWNRAYGKYLPVTLTEKGFIELEKFDAGE
jgi:hypothetical protein